VVVDDFVGDSPLMGEGNKWKIERNTNIVEIILSKKGTH
jgi:hypothetical protein